MQESWPYKRDLLRFASEFQRRATHQIWRDSSLWKAEQLLFVGFYFVRKLIENRKVTDGCARRSILIQSAKLSRDREVSDFMRYDLEKDLETAEFTDVKVDVSQLCDKIIHVWWCTPIQRVQGGLAGYIFTTDRKKNAELWLLPTESIVDVFTSFGRNEIRSLRKMRDADGRLTFWQAE